MVGINSRDLWEGSLIGRFLLWVLVVWDNSLLGRAATALGRFGGRVFRGSFFGRVFYSNWPEETVAAESLTARVLTPLSRLAARVGGVLGPVLRVVWEGSFLAGLATRFVQALAPFVHSSLIYQTLTGYADDVVHAPDEAPHRPTPVVVPLLGFLLGFASLIPTGTPGLPSPTFILVGGVWLLAALWILQKWMQGDFTWRASSALLPLAVFLMTAVVATVESAARGDSLLNLVLWLTALLLFWMTVNTVRTSRDVAFLLGPILVAGALMGLWAAYQYFINPPVITENWSDPEAFGNLVRVFAGFGNPNYLAEYMELFLPIGVALWFQQPKRRFELGGLLALMFFALLLTSTRGAWLGVMLALGLFILMRAGRSSVLLFLGGAAGLVALQLLAPGLMDWVLKRLLSAFTLTDTSNAYRTNLWRGVVAMLEYYWPLGAGLGAVAFEQIYAGFALGAAKAAHAHNVYLQIFAETGILGLVAILWAMLAVVRRPFAVGLSKRSPLVTAAVPTALLAILFHGLVEHIWYNPKLLFAFWAVAGLGMGLTLGRRKDTPA